MPTLGLPSTAAPPPTLGTALQTPRTQLPEAECLTVLLLSASAPQVALLGSQLFGNPAFRFNQIFTMAVICGLRNKLQYKK